MNTHRLRRATAGYLAQAMKVKLRKPLVNAAVQLYHRADSALSSVAAAMVAAIKSGARKLALAKSQK